MINNADLQPIISSVRAELGNQNLRWIRAVQIAADRGDETAKAWVNEFEPVLALCDITRAAFDAIDPHQGETEQRRFVWNAIVTTISKHPRGTEMIHELAEKGLQRRMAEEAGMLGLWRDVDDEEDL
jgi:hypothetical protein